MPRRVVFVTYTMVNPNAVGVFFRALRLGVELQKRGWSFTVFNVGPIPEDPKVDRARACGGQIVRLDIYNAEFEVKAIHDTLVHGAPDIVVLGEEPFTGMLPYYQAARMVNAPFVLLDQLYDADAKPDKHGWGFDGVFLYGLRAIWSQPLQLRFPYEIVPPFIDEVSPGDSLPMPESVRKLPRVTVLGLDERVLERGIELVAGYREPIAIVTLSRSTENAERRMEAAGIAADRRVALPLLYDADLYGWIASSRIAIVANGFMQMMETLALGCPAICVDRGIGLWPWSLARQLTQYVSLCDPFVQQRERFAEWMRKSPFGDELRASLQRERRGAGICADYLEAVADRRRLLGRIQRWGLRVDWHVRARLRRERVESRQPRPPGGAMST